MISNNRVPRKKIDFTVFKSAYPTCADIRFCVSLATSLAELSVLATAELNSVLIAARIKSTGMIGATDAIILIFFCLFQGPHFLNI